MVKERDEYETQLTWRTLSSLGISGGFIVWDVLQVIGEPKHDTSSFFDTLDNEQIYIACFHFWTRESAESFLNEPGWYQAITIIPEKKPVVSIQKVIARAKDLYLGNSDADIFDFPG